MKKLTLYYCRILALTLFLGAYSCSSKKENVPDNVSDRVPENVRLSDRSNSSITVAWDHIEGATSYTIQLLKTKENASPIPSYTTISKDSYLFTGLEETSGYYVRVRSNFNTVPSDWVYIMNGPEPARIMPKFGIVAEDFVVVPEPQLYPNFPEGWEVHEGARKSGHTSNGPTTGRLSDIFPSGEWLMTNMYTHSGSNLPHKNGTWAVLMAASVEAYLTMDFDLPNGAAKFSFVCGTATHSNANDNAVNTNPITVKVEYSQNAGSTWTQLGSDLLVNDRDVQYFTEYKNLNIQGPVRFRIGQDASAARLLVDDVAVYFMEK